MTSADIFRKLVKHDLLTDDDITEIQANPHFRYYVIWSANACLCAYTHEYFDYIEDDGEVDEAALNSLCIDLDNGICKHAKHLTDMTKAVASVSAVQVAIAVKNTSAYQQLMHHGIACETKSQCFEHSEVHTAVLKSNYAYFNTYKATQKNNLEDSLHYAVKIVRSTTTSLWIYIDMTIFELCVKQNNAMMVKTLLHHNPEPTSVLSAISVSIQEDNTELTELLVSYVINNDAKTILSDLSNLCLYAILNNSVETLRILHKYIPLPLTEDLTALGDITLTGVCNFLDLAYIFGYSECVEFLQQETKSSLTTQFVDNVKNASSRTRSTVGDQLFSVVLHKTSNTPDFCIKLLYQLADRGYNINKLNCQSNTIKSLSAGERYSSRYLCIYQTMLDIGLQINFSELCNHITSVPLTMTCTPELDVLRSVLYQNPKLNQQQKAKCIELAIYRDACKTKIASMDSKVIHDNQLILPVLFDAGYKYSPLSASREDRALTLPIRLCDILDEFLFTPRSLKHQCRDTLRAHFEGRQVHKYVIQMQCPASIKHFILMEHLREERPNTCKHVHYCNQYITKLIFDNDI